MINWNELFCGHFYIEAPPWEQFGLSRGLKRWYCIKCNKYVFRDINWIPIQ